MAPGTREVVIVPARPGVRTKGQHWPKPHRLKIEGCVACIVLLALLFLQPLASLALYAAGSDLNSYVLLVPLVSGYLLYTKRRTLPVVYVSSFGGAAILSAVAGAAVVSATVWGDRLSFNDELGLLTLAFVASVAACGFLFLGAAWMSAAAFAVGFLIFMAPLPDALVDSLEQVLVLGSAELAAGYFKATGTPVLREQNVFALPGIVLHVAPECSGIHSSWVLFITSLVAAQICLKSRWRRAVVLAVVLPLGVMRNAFRILVIGLLCVHVGPHAINGAIHHHGGPIFFAMSLLPLFLLVMWMRRQERRISPAP